MENADLYLQWVNSHGLTENNFPEELANLISFTQEERVTSLCLLTTIDNAYVLDILQELSASSDLDLYHFTELRRSRYNPANLVWDVVGGEVLNADELIQLAQDQVGNHITIFEGFFRNIRHFFKNDIKSKQYRRRFEKNLEPIPSLDGRVLIFLESPETTRHIPPDLIKHFTSLSTRIVEIPDDQGFFRKGQLLCILPFLRAYLKMQDPANEPQPGKWTRIRNTKSGWTRFLRADQFLDCVADLLPVDAAKEHLASAIQKSLMTWLVPVEEPLINQVQILDRRVEAIRITDNAGKFWSQMSRQPNLFPNEMRKNVVGLDPVHTPENERAGLSRYLCAGWSIDDVGGLSHSGEHSLLGPSTSRIPYRYNDAPRRLMLASSLQTRAVSLEETSDKPETRVGEDGWEPPGKNLFAVFSTAGGWTHEDAIILSRSASHKLRRWYIQELQIPIPAIISRVEVQVSENDMVPRGNRLVRAFIDLFALGWRSHEVEKLEKEWGQRGKGGWLEVALPKVYMPLEARILEIRHQSFFDSLLNTAINPPLPHQLMNGLHRDDGTQQWRELITFIFEVRASVEVGDKLSTRHGIKGVVSRILDDNDEGLPSIGGHPAEIVFSPVGIARRGAMGQFREAMNGSKVDALPKSGTVFVMRQIQDAALRCRIRGGGNYDLQRGQRYGEMEFWALMAHGAPEIAEELLSPKRSTSRWMKWESHISNAGHRKSASQAINRYLALLNTRIENGQIIDGAIDGAFLIPSSNFGDLKDAWDLIEDSERFAVKEGLGYLELKEPINIEISSHLSLRNICKVYVLPPWLRPVIGGLSHKLTEAYRSLIKAIVFSGGDNIAVEVANCVKIALDDKLGLPAFIRREVLGRRLTRSARAVITPRPDLRIDQISIPQRVADALFEGLPEANRNILLVNRNPTLHRLGLIALRPVIEKSDMSVFGLPLGILKVLGADFDGDQATVVALENPKAVEAAERLLPGAVTSWGGYFSKDMPLRNDPFRINTPAFPLLQELSDLDEESLLAQDRSYSQINWCEAYQEILDKQLNVVNDGWPTSLMNKYKESQGGYLSGLTEKDWMERAEEEMDYVYTAVRNKGRFGGLLRREFYKQTYTDEKSIYRSIGALQAITERLVQLALTVKTGGGASAELLSVVLDFLENPTTESMRNKLQLLEPSKSLEAEPSRLDPVKLSQALNIRQEPTGLLAWLANPKVETLLSHTVNNSNNDDSDRRVNDPRIAWFIG